MDKQIIGQFSHCYGISMDISTSIAQLIPRSLLKYHVLCHGTLACLVRMNGDAGDALCLLPYTT